VTRWLSALCRGGRSSVNWAFMPPMLQVADRDRCGDGIRQFDPFPDVIVERELPLLREQEDAQCGELLGERREVERGARRDLDVVLEIRVAVATAEHEGSVLDYRHGAPRRWGWPVVARHELGDVLRCPVARPPGRPRLAAGSDWHQANEQTRHHHAQSSAVGWANRVPAKPEVIEKAMSERGVSGPYAVPFHIESRGDRPNRWKPVQPTFGGIAFEHLSPDEFSKGSFSNPPRTARTWDDPNTLLVASTGNTG
jgi:hypothetical protein